MKNFSDGINPNAVADETSRRYWKTTREALKEIERQLGKISTGTNAPTVTVSRATNASVQGRSLVLGDEEDPTRRAVFDTSNVPSGPTPTIYYLPSTGGTILLVEDVVKSLDIRALGPYQIDEYIDPVVVPEAGTVTGVRWYRKSNGTTGTTQINLGRLRLGSNAYGYSSNQTLCQYFLGDELSGSLSAPDNWSDLSVGDVLHLRVLDNEGSAEDLILSVQYSLG